MNEYLRPWKLATLALGIAALVCGQYVWPAPDWDTGVSLVMAGLTYLVAPFFGRVWLERDWRRAPMALLNAWLCVDGCYFVYWWFVDPRALVMRAANAPASLALFLACVVLWTPRLALRDLLPAARRLRGPQPRQ